MKVYHWWPGREWAGPCPIPEDVIALAEKRGSKYVTVAKARIIGFDDDSYIMGTAFCCPKDAPTRKYGRELAIERLTKTRDVWFPGMEL